MQRLWTEEEINYLKSNYLLKTNLELGKNLGRGRASVMHKLSALKLDRGIPHYQHLINHDYFKNLSHEMWYWVGFLAADGNIYERKNVIQLKLSLEDLCIVERFRQQICSQLPITLFKNKTLHKGEIKYHDQAKLSFVSKKIIADLKNYGVIPRKTGNEFIPLGLTNEFFGDWLRGLWDGDGCYTWSKKSKKSSKPLLQVSLCSHSKRFLNQLKERIGGHICRIKNSWTLQLRVKEVFRLYDLLYTNDKIEHNRFCLVRKKTEMIAFIQQRKDKSYKKQSDKPHLLYI